MVALKKPWALKECIRINNRPSSLCRLWHLFWLRLSSPPGFGPHMFIATSLLLRCYSWTNAVTGTLRFHHAGCWLARTLVPTKLQILSSKWPFIRCDAISRCLSHRLPSCRWLCFFSSLRFLPKYDCYFIRLVFFLLPHFFLAQQNIITWSRIYTIEIQRCSMILSFLTLRLSPQIVGS